MIYYSTFGARVDVYTPSQKVSASQAASFEQRREAKREQKDDECLEADERRWRVAKAANNTAAVAAAREACRASKDVIAAKPGDDERLLYIFGPDHDKKRLRALRAERERELETLASP